MANKYPPGHHLSAENCRKRGFQRGHVTNAGGRPTIIPEVKELAKQQTEAAIEALATIMGDKKANASARVQAAVALLDRGWGRPKQNLDITVDHQASGLAAALDALRDRAQIAGPVIDVEPIEVTVVRTVKGNSEEG